MTTTGTERLLFGLPSEVMGMIFRDWLEFRSLVRVDSAFCNHDSRPMLFKYFASELCTQERPLSNACAQWFCKRKMHISIITLAEASQDISRYLRLFSKSIWSVRCFSDDAIDLVATNCRHLTFFMCGNIAAKPNLNASLGYNLKLQELRLENVKELQVSHFEDVCLPHLKLVSLYRSNCKDEVLSAVVRTTEKLEHLNIGECASISEEGIIASAQHCPLLRSLGLGYLQVGDGALTELTTLCPRIDNIHLQYNELVTDTGVLSIARNLTELRILGLGNCEALTDLSLQHLAQHSASTLTTLYAIGYQQVRVEVLVLLLKQCSQLRNVVLDCDIQSYCAEIVPHMKNLYNLCVDCLLFDDCLRLFARHCKQLQKLGIPCIYKVAPDVAAAAHQSALEERVMHRVGEDAVQQDLAYTEYGLLALVDGLPNLQVLWTTDLSDGAIGALLAQRLWRRLCPGLRFVDNHHEFYLDVLNDRSV